MPSTTLLLSASDPANLTKLLFYTSTYAPQNASFSVSDSGVGVEGSGIAVACAATDGGSGVDFYAISESSFLSDAGVGIEAVGLAVGLPSGDSGSGTESGVLAAALNGTDVGVGAESLASLFFALSVIDSGVAAGELGSYAVGWSSSDVASVQEAAVVAAAVAVIETALALDSVLLIGADLNSMVMYLLVPEATLVEESANWRAVVYA